MKVIERIIQEINPGKNTALEDIDKRFDVIEGPLGFPSKKRLWCFSGPHYTNTIVIEREWESMAVMEAVYEKFVAHPGIQTLLGRRANHYQKFSYRTLYSHSFRIKKKLTFITDVSFFITIRHYGMLLLFTNGDYKKTLGIGEDYCF